LREKDARTRNKIIIQKKGKIPMDIISAISRLVKFKNYAAVLENPFEYVKIDSLSVIATLKNCSILCATI
jgi:hypothetical protein